LIDDSPAVLGDGSIRHVALANPRTAPYGAAAVEALEALGFWASVERRLVYGENVGQAYGFVSTGNAEIGFIALAQISMLNEASQGSFWVVPSGLHSPIEQQAVLLSFGRDNPAAIEFMDYLRSSVARSIIERSGYDVVSTPTP
jgi:molybdate transport system substrate-binding protein